MLEQTYHNYTIRYEQDMITLEGDSQAIHSEAEKIMRRFAFSARPYRMITVDDNCVVLTVPH